VNEDLSAWRRDPHDRQGLGVGRPLKAWSRLHLSSLISLFLFTQSISPHKLGTNLIVAQYIACS